jgi:hypothetical protein
LSGSAESGPENNLLKPKKRGWVFLDTARTAKQLAVIPCGTLASLAWDAFSPCQSAWVRSPARGFFVSRVLLPVVDSLAGCARKSEGSMQIVIDRLDRASPRWESLVA